MKRKKVFIDCFSLMVAIIVGFMTYEITKPIPLSEAEKQDFTSVAYTVWSKGLKYLNSELDIFNIKIISENEVRVSLTDMRKEFIDFDFSNNQIKETIKVNETAKDIEAWMTIIFTIIGFFVSYGIIYFITFIVKALKKD